VVGLGEEGNPATKVATKKEGVEGCKDRSLFPLILGSRFGLSAERGKKKHAQGGKEVGGISGVGFVVKN